MSAIPERSLPGGSPEKGPRARILVVDDRATSREVVKVALGSLRFEVAEASGGLEALDLLATRSFDLVLLDVMMPDLDGFEVLKSIRGRLSGSECPVIMLTVKDDSEDVVTALKLGANDYVAKPIDVPELVARIETQLLRKQAEDTLREARDHLEQRIRERTVELRAMNQALHDEIRDRKGIEERLRESERRYRVLYDENPSMIYTVSRDGVIVSVNDFGAGQLGFTVDELVGTRLVDLHPDAERMAGTTHLEACWGKADLVHRWETRNLRKNGSSLWVRVSARVVEQEGASNLFLVCEDITEAYNLSQQLSYQASHDPLTGLVNRREFEQRLGRVLEAARKEPVEHALCYLDLDQFKVINDTCGHVAGDELLRQLSGVLQANVRRRDTLARLGGDEFGVLMEHCSLVQAQRVANSLRSAIEHFRFRWSEKTFTLGVSIGLVPIAGTADSVADVMSAADNACYVAKDGGRNRIHVFRTDDEQLVRRHGEMQWVVQIQRALDEGRFFLNYQPITRLGDGFRNGGRTQGEAVIDQYELLLRMRDDKGVVVPPGAFLPAAERYNLSTKIDRWVVGAAFQWLADHPVHLSALKLCSINLSGHSMGDEQFLEFVNERFRAFGIAPEKICFEITETAAITNLSSASHFIKVLKEWGCRFALDDFGSGVSSFAYLKSLPVDTLKIDGVFVKDILVDPLDLAMVTSFNQIGRVTGKQTIAEFVESQEILEKLVEIGVDYAQGYGIGRPRPLTDLARE